MKQSVAAAGQHETAAVVLADLEHVLRLPRHPVRLRAAERERQPHLPDARREHGRHPDAVDRRAADRPDRAADRRLSVRSHLDRARAGAGPYFLVGAVLATLALFVMPNSPTLWIAAGLLWMLDASINISMEPFRAFVGDQLPVKQRASGYAMQSFFIGVGSVVASLLPWLLAKARRRATPPRPGEVPDTVRYAFYFGGAVLLRRDRAGRCCARANIRRKRCKRLGRSAAAGAAPRATPRASRRDRAGLAGASALAGIAAVAGLRPGQAAVRARRPGRRPTASRCCCAPACAATARSPTSWTTCTTCRRRCGSSRWCSSSRGSRCSRCGSTPPAR